MRRAFTLLCLAAALVCVMAGVARMNRLEGTEPPGTARDAGDGPAAWLAGMETQGAVQDTGYGLAAWLDGSADTEADGNTTDETEAPLPARYDLREAGVLSEPADQGALSTCWAFASLSALQSSMPEVLRTALSVDHMTMHNSFGRTPDEGGTSAMSAAYLLSWQGPVAETDDPYGDGISPEGLSPVCHVQEIQYLQPKNYEEIKRCVMQYGGVESSLYFPQGADSLREDFYRAETNSFYYNGEEEPNHAVVIVGWDDGYPKESFAGAPEADGAFLCQNSWGESFGEDGFFYVSYEDTGIGTEAIAYTDVESADNFDGIYQTDLCGWTGTMGYGSGSAWFSNVYTAAGQETIEAAGIYATKAGTSCRIYGGELPEPVDGDVAGGLRDLLKGGSLLASVELEEAGYYTVPFSEVFPVQEGQRFALIVEISSMDTEEPVAVEGRMSEWTENVDITDGEGYISYDAVIWERVETKYDCNLCLKAYSRKK